MAMWTVADSTNATTFTDVRPGTQPTGPKRLAALRMTERDRLKASKPAMHQAVKMAAKLSSKEP